MRSTISPTPNGSAQHSVCMKLSAIAASSGSWPMPIRMPLGHPQDADRRQGDRQRHPQALAHDAARPARLAGAQRLGHQGCRGHRHTDAADQQHMEQGDGQVAAASDWAPRRPRNSTSVVLMAIWPSWVSASGRASASVARISAPQDAAGMGAAVARMVDIFG